MPEGDTIFRSARTLDRALAGSTVVSFETAYAPLASVNDNTPVAGRTIENVESRGKWLLIHFSGDLILVTHMLMSGSWHIYRRGEKWRRARSHMRIAITTDQFQAIGFDVPVAQFHTAKSLARHASVPKLGPDLLGKEFATEDAIGRLRAHATEEIANVLLNQQVVAGIGNVFKSEICFECSVNPFRLVSSLTRDEVNSLLDRSRKLMKQNVSDNSGDAIVTYTGGRRTTGASNPGARLYVYGRRGKPCRRCGAAILTRKQGIGARSTYWCPVCQPMLDDGRTIEGWTTPIDRRKVGCT
jgi:endonuclease VIII